MIFFFGRDGVIKDVKEKIDNQSVMAILGPSGSGKSSLVQAGLLPLFRKDSLVMHFTPGTTPNKTFFSTILKSCPEDSRGKLKQKIKHLRKNKAQLNLLFQEILNDSSKEGLIILIDQFEEIFTHCAEDLNRQKFLSLLEQVATAITINLKIIIAMRTDFIEKCANYTGFYNIFLKNVHLNYLQWTRET